MCQQCDEWVAARTRPDWPIRLRRVFGRAIKGGPLPKAERARDARGRFLPV